MGVRSVHYALDAAQLARVLSALDKNLPLFGETRRETLGAVLSDVEDSSDRAWFCDTDKAWDAMHRVLGDGTFEPSENPTALQKVIFGGREIAPNSAFLVMPSETPEVATAMEGVTREWFFKRFDTLLTTTDYFGPGDAEDRDYTWRWLEILRDFFRRTATAGRAVVFCVNDYRDAP